MVIEFEQIYQTYFQDVFRFVRKLSGRDDIAQEITSQTFFLALRSLDSFRGECSVRVWLCQIAKNCYYTYHKKHGKCEQREADHVHQSQQSIEQQIIEQSDTMHIHKLLHKLPEPYKEVFMLRVFGELRFEQIGELFGKTANWACVTYHRAVEKIREQWGSEQYD